MLFILHFINSTTLEARAENIFLGFLVQMKSLEFAFEINWPLAGLGIGGQTTFVHEDSS